MALGSARESRQARAPLTAEELARLDTLGYVVVPHALAPSEVARLLAAFEQAPPQTEGTQHVELDAKTPELAAWQALEHHPALESARTHVLRSGPYQANLHGRNPLPGFGDQGLHTDAPPRGQGDAPSVLTAIWMLDDFTPENGATRVVPGTHRRVGPIPKSLAQPGARHPDELVVTAGAASLLLFDGHLWHSGRQNQSRGPRRAAQQVFRSARRSTSLL